MQFWSLIVLTSMLGTQKELSHKTPVDNLFGQR